MGLFPEKVNKPQPTVKPEYEAPIKKEAPQLKKPLPKLDDGIKTTSIKRGLRKDKTHSNEVISGNVEEKISRSKVSDDAQKEFTIEELQEAWRGVADIFDSPSVESAIHNSSLSIDTENNNKVIIEVASAVQKGDLKELILDIATHIRGKLKNECITFDFKVKRVKKDKIQRSKFESNKEILEKMMMKNKNILNFCKKYKLRIKDD